MGALLSFLFGAAHATQLSFAAKPAHVELASARAGADATTRTVSLEELVAQRCPSLRTPFEPVWWLPNGHFQTAYSALGRLGRVDPVVFRRTLLRTVDGGTLGLDFAHPMTSHAVPDDTPIIVILSGLTGGSHESYVRAVVGPACSPVEAGGLGYRAVVVNFRGCGGVPLTSPRLYSAGCTADLRMALLHIAARHPRAPLLGVAFSLGASIIARYLAEEGARSRLKAACVLGCPWDMVANGEKLVSTWWRKHIYAAALGANLRALAAAHAAQLAAHPALAAALPRLRALRRPRLDEVDALVTRVAGGAPPAFPFASVRAYYAWASARARLPAVRAPLLALHAADDPVVGVLPARADLGPGVVLGVTRGGGHLGWFARGGRRWFVKPVLEWVAVMAREVRLLGVEAPREAVCVDGWATEEGMGHLGYRVVAEGGVLDEGGVQVGVLQGL